MFHRWGAFVYRFRRPVAILAVIVAILSLPLASQVTGALSAGGWTDPDSESAAVSTRLAEEFGAGGGAIVALFRGEARRRRAFAGVPGDDHRVAGAARRGRARGWGHRLGRDRRRPLHQHGRHDGLRRRRAGHRRRRGRRPHARVPRPHRPARRPDAPADRRRPRHRGPGGAGRARTRAGRDGLVPLRGAHPDPRLRLTRGGRHAARRRRVGDPHDPRGRLRRGPGDGALHLRPERRDDAGPGACDRLLALHGEPLPRGAPARARRRHGGPGDRRDQRQGGRVLRPGCRDRPVGAAPVRALGVAVVRHRRCARCRGLRLLCPHLPARRPRDAGAAYQRRRRRRSPGPDPAAVRAPDRRRGRRCP